MDIAWTKAVSRGCANVHEGDRVEQLESCNVLLVVCRYGNLAQVLMSGCYASLGNYAKAQELLDVVPPMLEPKKAGGKKLPTEVFIEKKSA